MEKTQHTIHKMIGAIQVGLLRYNHKGEKISMPVQVTLQEGNTLHCVVTDFDCLNGNKLLNKILLSFREIVIIIYTLEVAYIVKQEITSSFWLFM